MWDGDFMGHPNDSLEADIKSKEHKHIFHHYLGNVVSVKRFREVQQQLAEKDAEIARLEKSLFYAIPNSDWRTMIDYVKSRALDEKNAEIARLKQKDIERGNWKRWCIDHEKTRS